jgi:hypothetical protein
MAEPWRRLMARRTPPAKAMKTKAMAQTWCAVAGRPGFSSASCSISPFDIDFSRSGKYRFLVSISKKGPTLTVDLLFTLRAFKATLRNLEVV